MSISRKPAVCSFVKRNCNQPQGVKLVRHSSKIQFYLLLRKLI